MMLRADHVGGALFILGGLLIFVMSGDLPFGTLAFPGAGFMPLILATLLIAMGALLALGAAQSLPFADIDWGDLPHAVTVLAVAAVAIAFYTVLGFLIVVPLMCFALLVVNERKPLLTAAAYSIGLTVFTYWLFVAINARLPTGMFGF